MQHNRQWSVRKGRSGKPLVRVKQWRAFEGSATSLGTKSGYGVIGEYHESNKLLCDFDTEKRGRYVRGRVRDRRGRLAWRVGSLPDPPLQSLAHTLGLKIVWQRWDKTRRGWHLTVKVKQKLTLAEIVCCQALLGSDSARERLNLARAISLRLHPSKFWEARANILYKRKVK